jgi:hypothetical protein
MAQMIADSDRIFDRSWVHGLLFKPLRSFFRRKPRSQELAAGKLCCWRSTRPQAVSAVGLRQKALLQRFLIATTAYSCFPQPAYISGNRRYPRRKD